MDDTHDNPTAPKRSLGKCHAVRTITLTNRPPVRIREDQWPIIARGTYSWHDGQCEAQANTRRDCRIIVLEHSEGRAIVYGYYDFDSCYPGASLMVRAGELLGSGEDVASAIRIVAATLVGAMTEAGHDEVRPHVAQAERACIAALPPQDL